MIIVYVDTMEDTSTFKSIYEGVDCIFLYNPKRDEVIKTLEENPTDTLLCFGHGSPYGLFSSHAEEHYLIDGTMVSLLTNREMIGIWCYASQFGIKYNLKGFFTYMFISNAEEAKCFRYESDNEVIFEQNKLFSKRINHLITSETPLCEWVEKLNEEYDKSLGFNEFNYSNLNYLDGEGEGFYEFTDKTIFDDNIDFYSNGEGSEEDFTEYLIHFALQDDVEGVLFDKFGEDFGKKNVDDITDKEFIEIATIHYKTIEEFMDDFNHRCFLCPDPDNYYMRIIKK